jgi:cyclopropane fatty-acyl-phospholipid synthase-like methyltransferase
MSNKNEFWREFWKTKSDPLHTDSTQDYYDRMARELSLLFDIESNMAVYEMACGSGTFFRSLGFDRTRYVGVDYSPAMIEAFRTKEPQVNASVADVRDFTPPGKVDLIYSNGMLQYLSVLEVEKLIKHSAKLLNEKGSIVHAAVPWKALRWELFSGALTGKPQNVIRAGAIHMAEITRLKPSLGTWFSPSTLRRIGQHEGLAVTFYGSHYYPYRFHVKMTKRVS